MVGKRNPCLRIECLNNFTCEYRGPNKFACVSERGLCNTNPCTNGRLCTQRSNHYVCTCPFGYTGDDCSVPVLPKRI